MSSYAYKLTYTHEIDEKPTLQRLTDRFFMTDSEADEFIIQVVRNDSPVIIPDGITAHLLREDNTELVWAGEKQNTNEAHVLLPQEAYAIPGKARLTIQFVNGSEKVPIFAADLFISRNASSDQATPGESVPDMSRLVAIVERAEAAAATVEEITADAIRYSAQILTDEQQEQARQNIGIDEWPVKHPAHGYPLIPSTAEGWMEQGTLSLADGTEMASTTRIRYRSMIPVQDIARFEADDGYQIYVLCFDKAGAFLGVWYQNGLRINAGLWHPVCNILNVPAGVAYVRPMMSKANGENIVIGEAKALKVWRRMNEAAFDAENPFRPQLMNSVEPYLTYGLAGFELLEPGAIDGTGANADGAQYVNNSRRTPGLWPLNGAESIVSHLEWITIVSAYNYIFWYTANGTYISRTGGRNTNTVIGTPPSNAAYFRVSLTSTTAGDINDENVTDYVIKWRVINPNVRKKWYVLGDSISAGYYSLTKTMADEMGVEFFYESPVTAPDGDATGSLYDPTLQHNYWGYANRWINKALVPLGTPGQGYFRTAFNSKNGINVVQENDFAGADLITVAWGFNDWHYNQPRGNHELLDASEPYATATTDATRITTVNQAIWYCLGVLIDKAPDAEIVVQTPMNAWAYGGDFASNWSINYALSNSGTLAQIHDDIVYWADYYGLKVIDLTYNNSFVNRQNIKSAIIDGSHPSDETHKRLGRYVANTLTGVTDVRRTDVAGSMAEFKAYLGLT